MRASRDEADNFSFVGQGMSGDIPAQREAWAGSHAAWVRTGGRVICEGDEFRYRRDGWPEPVMPQPPGPRVKQRAPRIDLIELTWTQMERVQ